MKFKNILTIGKMTFQSVVGNRKALRMVFIGALLFGLSTYALSQSQDATVVTFTWTGIGFLFLVISYQAADLLREDLRKKTLTPIITAPISRLEYSLGRFFGLFVPGWVILSGLYWLLFEYGVVRTEGYEIVKNVAFLTRQLPDFDIPLGLPAAKELATVFWTLLSSFMFVVMSALYFLSAKFNQKAAIALAFCCWPLISWFWRLPIKIENEVFTSLVTMGGLKEGWPALPTMGLWVPIIVSGKDAIDIASIYAMQSIAWSVIFIFLGYRLFKNIDLSRPQ